MKIKSNKTQTLNISSLKGGDLDKLFKKFQIKSQILALKMTFQKNEKVELLSKANDFE